MPILSMNLTYWRRLDVALKTRVRGIIANMSASNTIKYRIVTVADKIAELRSDVIDHVTTMNNADRLTVLASRAAKFLVPLAIEEHTSSGSFDTVNMLAGTVLIPFSPLFGAEDITTLFRKIEENQKSSINQVYLLQTQMGSYPSSQRQH